MQAGSGASQLLVQDGILVWSDATQVGSVAATGGPATRLAELGGVPGAIAARGSDAFWIDEVSGFGSAGCAGATAIRVLKKTTSNGITTDIEKVDNCDFALPLIVVDSASVWWVSSAGMNRYQLRRTPIQGGPSEIVATALLRILALTRDSTNVYWMQEEPDSQQTSISRIPSAGGPVATVATNFGAVGGLGGLAVNATTVFYSAYGTGRPAGFNLMATPIAGGRSVVLASAAAPPRKLVADASRLYWTDGSSVFSLPVAGGTPSVLSATSNEIVDLAVRGDDVIWTEAIGVSALETGVVRTVPKAGGTAVTLGQGEHAPRQLAVVADWVWWVEGGLYGQNAGFGRVARVPAAGGAAETLAMNLTTESPLIAASGGRVFVADRWQVKSVGITGGLLSAVASGSDRITGLVSDGTFVYWLQEPGVVFRTPARGGASTLIGALPPVGYGMSGPLRLSNGTLYWMVGQQAILAVPAAGGPTQVIASGLPFVANFVVDSASIYYMENDTGLLKRIPAAGGPATVIASGLGLSRIGMAVDATHVYWIDQLAINRVPKTGLGTQTIASRSGRDPYVAGAIALDAAAVYWSDPPRLEISRIAK